MWTRFFAIPALLSLVAGTVTATPALRSVTGYFATADGDSSPYWTLADNVECFSALAPTWLSYDAQGTLTDKSDRRLIRYAHSHGIQVTPLVTIGSGKPADVAHALFADAAAVDRNVTLLLKCVKEVGADGINVDIEGVSKADRALYSAFIAALCKAFHAEKLIVTLDLPAKTADAPDEDWPGFADYPVLGREADQLQLMCYDENWAPGQPGPVGSLPWARKVLAYATSVIPKSKVILGVPSYGYDWPPSGPVSSLLGVQVDDLIRKHDVIPKWDNDAKSNWFEYKDDGSVLHTVYYESQKSLMARLDLAREYGIGGISMWRMGDESPGFLSPLKRFRKGR